MSVSIASTKAHLLQSHLIKQLVVEKQWWKCKNSFGS